MAQFFVLESTNSEEKLAHMLINIEQVCRVFATGPANSPESIEVHMSDGHRFILQAEAALAVFNLVTHPRNSADLSHPRPS
jgi:hypothetical protein